MMMSSMMGAIAFQKDLGAVHSCAHALGTVCDLHHGLANALMIEPVMTYNREAVPHKFAELAHAVGVPSVSGFVPWLAQLKHRIGIPPGLAAAGVKREHFPRLVEIATQDICHQTNPRPCAAADFERFFTEALLTWPSPAHHRHLGAHPPPGRAGARPRRRLHEDAALPRAIGRALGAREGRARGDDPGHRERGPDPAQRDEPGFVRRAPRRPGAARRRRHRARELRRNAAAPRMGRRPRARPLRDRPVQRLRRRGQAGDRHLPRLPADQRRARRHAVPGHPDPGGGGRSRTATPSSTSARCTT